MKDVRGFSEKELQKIKDNLKPFMADVVRELTGLNSTELSADIDKLFEFEDKLADVSLTNDMF